VKRLSVLLMVMAVLALIVPVSAQGPAPQVPDWANAKAGGKVYIVQMIDAPVVAYEGGIPGLAATKPGKGEKINPNSAHVRKYVSYLDDQHSVALADVGAAGKKVYDYRYSFNGFSAWLTGAELAALQSRPDVLQTWEDELQKPDSHTLSTPAFLGLTDEGGLWDMGITGEDVIIGLVDTGIWPENESFSDRTGANPQGKEGKLNYLQIPGWHGKCTPGEEFPASDCNQKLIGAQWFNSGWGGPEGVKALFPYEYISARDAVGHGSHTSSTAAGNMDVEVMVDDVLLGETSGIAPRARVAMYKVCWGRSEDDGGCWPSDSVAAIDQAVADGVDVINFSISGSRTSFLDAVEVAFLYAADAGVFVAASAGNAGPGAETVAHNSPWLTTVAAGTHDLYFSGTVTLGNGEVYEGAALLEETVSADLVYSADVGLAGADPTEVQLCYPGTLDPDAVTGKIVVCDRGTIARVDKSYAVMLAGGVGMVLANVTPASLNADLHSVLTVHVDDIAGAAIRAYAQTADATATLVGGFFDPAEAPFVASFSSRGPSLASGDLLKPDIMAPGVDVWASVSPTSGGRDFDIYSGTSMASPHIAGMGALMKQMHPGWSPAMIKSALMTTASQLTNEGNPIPGTPFDFGAGHLTPNSSADPGLVYDAGWIDWLGFLCGTGQLSASYCPAIGIDPSDLNYPSIAIGDLAGAQTVHRTVTNVGPAATYNVSVDAPAGIAVTVEPASLTLDTGQSAPYQVTFTNVDAPVGQWAFGSLTWSHGPHAVRSPIALRPVQAAIPSELMGAGTEGSLSFDITFGYTGAYTAGAHGLVPADMQAGNVVDDPANNINVALDTGVGITMHLVEVPAGSALARFSLFDDYTDGADDLDLYVFAGSGAYIGGSGSTTSAEEFNLPWPDPGMYIIVVHGFETDGPDANYTLFSWAVPATPGSSNMTLTAPASATLGATETIQVDWAGLDAGTKYLGAVSHSDAGGLFDLTLIGIDTD
jgi:hypothetical protein